MRNGTFLAACDVAGLDRHAKCHKALLASCTRGQKRFVALGNRLEQLSLVIPGNL